MINDSSDVAPMKKDEVSNPEKVDIPNDKFSSKYTGPDSLWIRHPLREWEVEGSIPSVGDIGVCSDMAGW